MNILKKIRINNVIAAILGILTGVIFIVFSQSVADLVTRIIGGLLIAAGVLFVLTYIICRQKTAYELMGLILGALMGVFGVVILANPHWFESLVALILGIVILASGIESITNALHLWKHNVSGWWIWFVLSLITAFAGLVLIVRRFEFSGTLIMICGIFFVYDGVTSLILTARLAFALRAARQEMTAVDVEAVVEGEPAKEAVDEPAGESAEVARIEAADPTDAG